MFNPFLIDFHKKFILIQSTAFIIVDFKEY